MERRDFLKSLGIAGTLSLAGICRANGWTNQDGKRSDARQGEVGETTAGLRGPFDVAVDQLGRLFVTDSPTYRVLSLELTSGVLGTFGGPGSAVGRLNYPTGISVDGDGLVYVVDSNNGRVQIFDGRGKLKRVVGYIGSAGGCLSTPQGIHVDEKNRLFIADTRNHRVQVFENFELAAVVGELGDGNDQFRLPTACVTRGEELLVLDSKHGMVKVFGPDFQYRHGFGAAGIGQGQLNMPQGMDLHPNGSVWVADTGNNRIQVFSAEGKLMSVLGRLGSEPGEFRSPKGLAWHNGNLFVADNGNCRIQILRDNTFSVVSF